MLFDRNHTRVGRVYDRDYPPRWTGNGVEPNQPWFTVSDDGEGEDLLAGIDFDWIAQ